MKSVLTALLAIICFSFCIGCGKEKLVNENADLKNQFSKSENENVDLKSQISKSESENKILMSQIELLKQQTNLDAQLKTEIESELDNYKQQIKDLQDKNAEKIKQTESDKAQLIKTDIEKIEAHLKKVFNEPQNFGSGVNSDEAELERLKQLANSEKAQVEDIIADLDGASFNKKSDLEQSVGKFFDDYGNWIFYVKAASQMSFITHDLQNASYQKYESSQNQFNSAASNDLSVIQGFENSNKP